jgi:hypothetical protein
MKTTRLVMSMFVVALITLLPALAGAEVLNLAPASSRVLLDDESGMAKVVLKFDLSGMREGEGRQVFVARLNWEVTGLPTEEISEIAAYAATSAWTPTSEAPTVSEDKAGSWQIMPGSDAAQEGLILLDLENLVDGWADGSISNYGVVLAIPDMSAETLASQLANARLEVRYSFLTW